MKNINRLTLEQEFKLALYEKNLRKLKENSVQKYLTKVLQRMMIKDNIIRYCIKNFVN